MSENRDVKVTANRFKLAEFVSTQFAVTVPPETTLDDLMKPEMWSHVALNLKPGDKIDVRWDDEKYFVQLYVNQCERTFANMYVLGYHDLRIGKEAHPGLLDGYKYKWRGPHHRHCIIREKDNVVMTSEHATKDDALKWLIDNKSRLAA